MNYYGLDDDIPAYWDRRYVDWLAAPDWDVFRAKDQWFETRLAHLLPPATDPPAGSVLDYGCGNAMFAVPLLRRYARYEGIDASRTALQIAQLYYGNKRPDLLERMRLQAYLGRPGEYPEPPGAGFDLVLSITVLQHQPVFLRRRMIDNIKRLLAPSGLYLGLEMMGDTQAYDMPPMSEADWQAAWAPWVLTFDRHPDHPEWWADNVWTARLPSDH